MVREQIALASIDLEDAQQEEIDVEGLLVRLVPSPNCQIFNRRKCQILARR